MMSNHENIIAERGRGTAERGGNEFPKRIEVGLVGARYLNFKCNGIIAPLRFLNPPLKCLIKLQTSPRICTSKRSPRGSFV